MEHNEVNALLERWAKKAANETSGRKLVLHTEPEPERGRTLLLPGKGGGRRMRLTWWSVAAAACIAAAVVVGTAIFTPPALPDTTVICMVNGKQVTDPASIEQYTREAFRLADENLRRPGATFTSMLDDGPTMTRVAEMLNELTNNQ